MGPNSLVKTKHSQQRAPAPLVRRGAPKVRPFPYKSLLVELARCEVASQQVGQGDACGPVVHALHREGVHAGIEVANHRSHVEEARDGLVAADKLEGLRLEALAYGFLYFVLPALLELDLRPLRLAGACMACGATPLILLVGIALYSNRSFGVFRINYYNEDEYSFECIAAPAAGAVRRGPTRLKQLMAAGVNCCYASDNIRDAWRPYGNADMMQEAMVAAHCMQYAFPDELETVWKMGTYNAAKNALVEGYGVEEGCNADLVVLDAPSADLALIGQVKRLYVVKGGKVVAKDGVLL